MIKAGEAEAGRMLRAISRPTERSKREEPVLKKNTGIPEGSLQGGAP